MCIRDRVLLENCITIVAVNEGVVPDDQRREQLAFLEDVFFKLLEMCIRDSLPVDVDSWGRSACYPQGNFYPLSDGISTHIPPDH